MNHFVGLLFSLSAGMLAVILSDGVAFVNLAESEGYRASFQLALLPVVLAINMQARL
ncbi:hypothetical protein IPP75_04245 [Candidatus Saccharibacteria bacterium]|nr:MAG: hypothetical protein IPP75_04245 [Candidatus Saccharibacteria bacterium]